MTLRISPFTFQFALVSAPEDIFCSNITDCLDAQDRIPMNPLDTNCPECTNELVKPTIITEFKCFGQVQDATGSSKPCERTHRLEDLFTRLARGRQNRCGSCSTDVLPTLSDGFHQVITQTLFGHDEDQYPGKETVERWTAFVALITVIKMHSFGNYATLPPQYVTQDLKEEPDVRIIRGDFQKAMQSAMQNPLALLSGRPTTTPALKAPAATPSPSNDDIELYVPMPANIKLPGMSFNTTKYRVLVDRHNGVMIDELNAVINQYNTTLGEDLRVRLKGKMNTLEVELQKVQVEALEVAGPHLDQLEIDLVHLKEDYQAGNRQLEWEMNEATRIQIGKQLGDLDKQITDLEILIEQIKAYQASQ